LKTAQSIIIEIMQESSDLLIFRGAHLSILRE
jgi:hypothetical protein